MIASCGYKIHLLGNLNAWNQRIGSAICSRNIYDNSTRYIKCPDKQYLQQEVKSKFWSLLWFSSFLFKTTLIYCVQDQNKIRKQKDKQSARCSSG